MQTVKVDICNQHVGRVRAQCAECRIDKTEGLLGGWRDAVTMALGEPCGDEHHCHCVGLLRKQLTDMLLVARRLLSVELVADDNGVVCILHNEHEDAKAFVRMLGEAP